MKANLKLTISVDDIEVDMGKFTNEDFLQTLMNSIKKQLKDKAATMVGFSTQYTHASESTYFGVMKVVKGKPDMQIEFKVDDI